jgi:hypothetical protein
MAAIVSNLKAAYVAKDMETGVYSLCVSTQDGSAPHVLQTSEQLDPRIPGNERHEVMRGKARKIAAILEIDYNDVLEYVKES